MSGKFYSVSGAPTKFVVENLGIDEYYVQAYSKRPEDRVMNIAGLLSELC